VQTPAEVLVEAGRTQRFTLSLPGYVPAIIEPFAPSRGAVGIVKTGKLAPGFPLRVETSNEGKIAISGAPHCKDLAPPTAECIVAAGTYTIDFVVAGNKFTRNVTVTNKPVTEKFDLGWVETSDAARLLVNGKFHKKLLLEAGQRTVTISDEEGVRTVQVRVKAGGTVTAK
jgi:hypothetical protein